MSNNNNNQDTKVCMKCGKRVMKDMSRTYRLSLTNRRSVNPAFANIDTVILCSDCDSARDTTIMKFLSNI